MNLRMNESKFDRIAVWLLGGFEWFDGCGEAGRLRFQDLSRLMLDQMAPKNLNLIFRPFLLKYHTLLI